MMTNFASTQNASFSVRFRNLFKPRDIFLHDGKSLRRFTIGAKIQMAATFAAFVLLAWSCFATFQAIALMNGDVAQMERQLARMQADVDAMRAETRNHAALLEQRQAFLASVISGQADASQLRALLPDEATQPRNAAARTASEPYAEIDGAAECPRRPGPRRDRASATARPPR